MPAPHAVAPHTVAHAAVAHNARPAAAPPRQTLGRQAHQRIRDHLISGALSPGEKLSLRSVAEGLGMSMQPVREAVARLVADEALEVTPNRAVRVPILSRHRFRELTTIRLSIEGFAAECAAANRSASDLSAIKRYDLAFRRQCQRAKPDAEAAVRANCLLHFAVYRAAGLPALVSIIEGLWLQIGPVLNLDMGASRERLQLGQAEACHAALVAAIADRAGRRAQQALQRDIRNAARFILAQDILVDEPRPVSGRSCTGDACCAESGAGTLIGPTCAKETQWSWESKD